MWLKIDYKLTPEIYTKFKNDEENNNLDDGINVVEYNDLLYKQLKIPIDFKILNNFTEYMRYNKVSFYSVKKIPEIIEKLIQKEYSINLHLNNLIEILHPNYIFNIWLNKLYTIPENNFTLNIIN
jgi:hypothetical protein